jgi:hypothetical protein
MANTNFPSQISKSRRIKEFGEDIGQLSPDVYVSHLNVTFLNMISQEVVSSLNMPHLFMKDKIFGYWDGTGVIAHDGNSLKDHSKISHIVHYPKNLWAAATHSASVLDCATEDNFLEDQQMREDIRKWQVSEVLFRSITQPTISVSETPTRSSEEEAEYQIPNSGVCLRYLKICWTIVRCEEHGEAWKRAHIPWWTECPVVSLWGTGGSWSCSCTLSGP